MTTEAKCGTCDGTKAVARDGGFDACPTCQGPTPSQVIAVRSALLSWMRDNDDVISDANGDHEALADSILAHPVLGKLLRGAP